MSSSELLDAGIVEKGLDAARVVYESLQLFAELDSTNAQLLRVAMTPGFHICVAESQTAGRGRRGRQWIAPLGCGLTFSCKQAVTARNGSLSGFSLAMGIALAEKLAELGLIGIALKWPNDLQVAGKKLAGLLIEVQPSGDGESQTVVTGVGLNYALTAQQRALIDQPCVSVAQLESPISRGDLLVALLAALAEAYREYEDAGFAAFYPRWSRWDVLQDKTVNLILPNRTLQGVAQGIDENGALQILIEGQLRRFSSGEVSVRVMA